MLFDQQQNIAPVLNYIAVFVEMCSDNGTQGFVDDIWTQIGFDM